MFANGADKLPVKEMLDATFKYCVLMYGMVNVSNKKVVLAAFDVIAPVTTSVSFTSTLPDT
jgi:hypothetical protein